MGGANRRRQLLGALDQGSLVCLSEQPAGYLSLAEREIGEQDGDEGIG